MVYVINGEHLTRRKLVTIDGSKVTTETNISLGLNINLPGVKSSGADVRLAKLNGTPMAREIECKDVPNADDVMIWYPWNTVASQNDQFYVYWGNSNLTEPAEDATYGREAVWDSNYKAVYHMAQDPSGTPPQLIDSTDNDVDCTSVGSMTSEDLINSEYGKAIDFDGINDGFNSNNTTITDSSVALTLTVKINRTAGAFEAICSKNQYNNNQRQFSFDIDSTEKVLVYLSSSGVNAFGTQISSGISTGWHEISFIWSTSVDSGYGTIIIDGVEITSYGLQQALTSALYASSESFRIGYKGSPTHPRWTTDDIAHVSVETVRRSVNYIITTHKNMNNPTASGTTPFYLSFGPTQHQRRTPQFIN